MALQRSIAFYCGGSIERWDSSSLWRGIGGSEEALIHMARQLSGRGWRVEVYGNPPDGGGTGPDGVRWRPHQELDGTPPGDVFVAWRDPQFVRHGRGWGQVHHWLHNRQEWPYPDEIVPLVDRILVVSRQMAGDGGFEGVDPAKIYRTSNGLDERFLCPPGDNEPRRAIYASCPARGLIAVLEMWPRIRRRVPDARLDVYYGFTAIYDDMARDLPGLRWIKLRCAELIDQPGVTFHGMVGQDRLAEGFARAGVWLYPTDCLEASCITAMKALAMGCLPITSGYGVLSETLGGRDLGPVDPRRPISRSRWRLRSFRRRTVRAMLTGGLPRVRARRLEWARWARETYSWRRVADDWCRLFAEVDASKGERSTAAP